MCMFCDTDKDGYVNALDKNAHCCIWKKRLRIRLYGKVWHIDINFCPMCGKNLKEKKMNPRKKLGFLKCGDLFIHDFVTYKAGHADGNGYAYCTNVATHKVTKICLDCEVEVKEQK